jgi:hypothetical protein
MSLLACAAVWLLTAGVAWADDLRPPVWRGADSTTLSVFDDWAGEDNLYEPDSFVQVPSAAGLYVAEAEVDGPASAVLGLYEGRTNVLEMSKAATLVFFLDNFDQDNPMKIVQMQITYHDSGCAPWWLYVDYSWDGDDDDFNTPLFELQDRVEYDQGGGWKTLAFSFFIEPNPWEEEVEIRFFDYGATWKTSCYIDQVVIDTICPEPATMSLLVVGGWALLRRRRPR